MRTLLTVAGVVLAACAKTGEAPAHSATTTDGATAASAAPAPSATWMMSETGWGPIHPGMTLAEAGHVLGSQIASPANPECDHVRPPKGPAGVLLMIVRGEVARVEVSDATVATTTGARVGDTEARINELYPGRVQTSLHKYVDGHYLTVRRGAGADSVHRLVFETDSRRVTRYRAGRIPEVELVEGCS